MNRTYRDCRKLAASNLPYKFLDICSFVFIKEKENIFVNLYDTDHMHFFLFFLLGGGVLVINGVM